LTPTAEPGIIGREERPKERRAALSTDLTRPGLERPATRADLARQLLARVNRLAGRLGDVSLAAEIQLLKRELSRGHAVLSGRTEDNNYLAVVCLVEAALASLTWKQYTPVVLAALRRAFSAGTRAGAVTFQEYDTIRRHFRASDIPVGPTIDLDAPDIEEGADGPPA
jgi:hypothetical protein